MPPSPAPEGNPRHRRIVDYLNDDTEECASPPERRRLFGFPRRIAPRTACAMPLNLFSRRLRSREPPKEAGKSPLCDGEVSGRHGSAAPKLEDTPANLGIGMALVFLLTKAACEFKKMAELRGQMEMICREIKAGITNTGNDHSLSEVTYGRSQTTSSYSTVGIESDNGALGNRKAVPMTEDISYATELSVRERSSEESLEEEFQAELDRLQLHSDTEESRALVIDRNAKAPEEAKNQLQPHSEELSDIVDADAEFDDEEEQNGVSALELERRLHDLLHQRQHEKIAALESALRRTERKLVEKDLEICFWREKSNLLLQQESPSA